MQAKHPTDVERLDAARLVASAALVVTVLFTGMALAGPADTPGADTLLQVAVWAVAFLASLLGLVIAAGRVAKAGMKPFRAVEDLHRIVGITPGQVYTDRSILVRLDAIEGDVKTLHIAVAEIAQLVGDIPSKTDVEQIVLEAHVKAIKLHALQENDRRS